MKKRLFIGTVAIVVIIVCFSFIKIFSPQSQGERACEEILYAYKNNKIPPVIEYNNIENALINTTIKDYKFVAMNDPVGRDYNVYIYKVFIEKGNEKEIITVKFTLKKYNIFSYSVNAANTDYVPTDTETPKKTPKTW